MVPPFVELPRVEEGVYVDIVSGEPLFTSLDKFDSDCGWSTFSQPIMHYQIKEKLDKSHGMLRSELRNKIRNSYLGHVFEDGPKNRGRRRYCINSASLRFINKKDLKREGYGEYMYLFYKNYF